MPPVCQNTFRILIADDHAMVRAGYRQFLQSEPGFVIAEASDGEQALRHLREQSVDLVLLDMQMPGQHRGLELLSEIRVGFPLTRVLVISGLPTNMYARHVMRSGASGYISKSDNPTDFIGAVRTVLLGRRYVSAELREMLVGDLQRDRNKEPHVGLSPRESQVLYQLASGKRLTSIAASLRLSVKTVSTYRRRILDKMSFRSNADITTYVFRNNLTPSNLLAEDAPPS